MRIGIDAGGTFTDFVILKDDEKLQMFKLRSNPADPASVILEGIRRATADPGTEIRHGSTVATNALLERKGARTAFITSPGFRDLLALGRQNRRDLYSLLPRPRPNLVPDELAFEWTGCPPAFPPGTESVAICLLNAYRDPSKEQEIERALRSTGLYVCRSSEIAPEFREYERASTTVLNAYVGPLMDRYLSRLESECPFPIRIMQSSGGLLSAATVRRHAVRTILSGPAGGVVAPRAAAKLAGWDQAIAFDMGGTSTDVSVVEDPLRFATEAWIEDLPIRVPLLDIHTVGAGGGSMASVDAGERLKVGPESAGAQPGPACYGTGIRATVTDAHVVLGRILPEHFVVPIDRTRAESAVGRIAAELRLSLREAALAIVRVANSNMERAIRVVTVEQGRDPRDFPLVAFGGCGGLHACEIAEDLGIENVIFPSFSGALSALGMLLAADTRDYAAGALGNANPAALVDRLEQQARHEQPEGAVERFADIRYEGQSYELTVSWEPGDPRRPFEDAYRRIYGRIDPERPIEIVAVRVRSTVPNEAAWFNPAAAREVEPVEGPAALFDYGSTAYIPRNWRINRSSAGVAVASRR